MSMDEPDASFGYPAATFYSMKPANQYEGAPRKRRTVRQAREVSNDLHRALTGEELPTVTTRACLERWLERKKIKTSPVTFAF